MTKLHSVVPILKNLITKGKIFDSDVNYVSFETIREIDHLLLLRWFQRWFFMCLHHAEGLEVSHRRIMSKRLFSKKIPLYNSKFVPVWEFHHLFPDHGRIITI
ncbi:hypothetical protein F8M41_025363 [Gigaspora margarita]|uniref:Uncharacterized protein n=1 Tax=Gigaspora margarita TaxID=4874 RepID=A0A8H3XKV6_GIGMA|nr:hypothetical protein F8M41_025363 [Gigaspora margarita]